jgi:hypothetical protein
MFGHHLPSTTLRASVRHAESKLSLADAHVGLIDRSGQVKIRTVQRSGTPMRGSSIAPFKTTFR